MIYLDTSALVKLVVRERETATLRRLLARADPAALITSALAQAELLRAVHRAGGDAATIQKAHEILDGVSQVTITRALLDAAGTLAPATLRTLDAIHLATALELGADLDSFVTYDVRLRAAAEQAGLRVLAPA